MLDIMRRKKRLKLILWLVILSLALGMLLFFVPGVNMGMVATDTSAASVDGQAIPMQDFAELTAGWWTITATEGRTESTPKLCARWDFPGKCSIA